MIGIGFCGGKESLIILHKYLINNKLDDAIVFRIRLKNEFIEIDNYIQYICEEWNINILTFDDMKECINILKEKYSVNLLILGNRRTDPYCNDLSIYQYTDTDWPCILRHFPLLNWTYKQVWEYIEKYNLPVCSLYERGYTSIGDSSNTFPNYFLFKEGKFLHAKYLEEDREERCGRIFYPLPFIFTSKVIHGKGIGKSINCPTANLETIPKLTSGVYSGCVIFGGKIYKMIMSRGYNPMFGDTTCEVHIIEYTGEDFYEEILEITVKKFIRFMYNFSDLNLLQNWIKKDIEIALGENK